MVSYKDRRRWVFYGFSAFVILVLLVSLLFLIFSEKKLPDNAIIVDDEIIRGDLSSEEAVKRVNELKEKEPVIAELPLVVEFYSDDYSSYTKYILSYGLDDSDRGFYLIMKDYTGVGMFTGINKLNEMGMHTEGLELRYEDLTEDALNFRADVL